MAEKQPDAHKHHPLNSTLANVTLIASGKGGVGKTWFSINFARSLVLKGKKVLLLDGDLGLANVDVQLGLVPQWDIQSVLEGRCALRDALMAYKNDRFHILPGQSGGKSLTDLSASKFAYLKTLLMDVAPQYDSILMDLGSGIGQTISNFAHLASQIIVLTTEEPTALTDAYALIKFLRRSDHRGRFFVVANQVTSFEGGDRVFQILEKSCEQFLNFAPEYLGCIRYDKAVCDAIKLQDMFLDLYPNNFATKDINRLRQLFTQKTYETQKAAG